jgi:hypothetical protein
MLSTVAFAKIEFSPVDSPKTYRLELSTAPLGPHNQHARKRKNHLVAPAFTLGGLHSDQEFLEAGAAKASSALC